MYLLEGSCAPSVPDTGGPPGIPGSPWPAEPNDFPTLELGMVPTPGTGVAVGPVDRAEPLTAPEPAGAPA
jgi:hypothetical protein